MKSRASVPVSIPSLYISPSQSYYNEHTSILSHTDARDLRRLSVQEVHLESPVSSINSKDEDLEMTFDISELKSGFLKPETHIMRHDNSQDEEAIQHRPVSNISTTTAEIFLAIGQLPGSDYYEVSSPPTPKSYIPSTSKTYIPYNPTYPVAPEAIVHRRERSRASNFQSTQAITVITPTSHKSHKLPTPPIKIDTHRTEDCLSATTLRSLASSSSSTTSPSTSASTSLSTCSPVSPDTIITPVDALGISGIRYPPACSYVTDSSAPPPPPKDSRYQSKSHLPLKQTRSSDVNPRVAPRRPNYATKAKRSTACGTRTDYRRYDCKPAAKLTKTRDTGSHKVRDNSKKPGHYVDEKSYPRDTAYDTYLYLKSLQRPSEKGNGSYQNSGRQSNRSCWGSLWRIIFR